VRDVTNSPSARRQSSATAPTAQLLSVASGAGSPFADAETIPVSLDPGDLLLADDAERHPAGATGREGAASPSIQLASTLGIAVGTGIAGAVVAIAAVPV
jgi:hypothetical protein